MISFGATLMRMGIDLKERVTEHCPQSLLLNSGSISTMVPSQVVLDIEDAYVRWADEIFCRGSGLAECPCVEVQ